MTEQTHMEQNEADMLGLLDLLDAIRSGDEQLTLKISAEHKWPVATLLHAKKAFGAEAVREMKMNTELADKELGEGWLDA